MFNKTLITALLFSASLFAANSIVVYELNGTTTTSYPIVPTMVGGHAGFAKGEIPNFAQAKVNGVAVTTQADITSRWSDGSVKETDLSYLIPTLTANGSVTVTFQNQATCHCTKDGSGTALTVAQMQAVGFNFDAQIQLTQPHCTGVCNTKTFSARQALTDGNYKVLDAGDVATVVEIASDGPCSTVGKCAYDMGWERDANSGNDFTTLTASITSSQTTIHVADGTGWTAPIDIEVWQGSATSYEGVANANPRPASGTQNAEHMTVTAVAYDSGGVGAATLTVTRHSNVPSGGHAFNVGLISGVTYATSVWPDRWKEPTSTYCPVGDSNCMNVFRPRVIAAFVAGTNQVKYRLTGEISDTQRIGDLTYNVLLTIGNTSPVTVWQQSNIYHIAGTRWTKSTFDWCEVAGSYSGNSASACGAGNTSTTVTSNAAHYWSVTPSGVTRAIVYPKDLWTGTGGTPTPVAVDMNAAYLSSSHTIYQYNYSGPTITEPNLDQSFTDTNGTGGGWSNKLSYGNFVAAINAGWTDGNIQGVTSSAYRSADAVHTQGAQMGTLDNAMHGGGGGSSEDNNGPEPYWIMQWLFSMGQSNDHGTRMYLKSRGNAEFATNWPFYHREGQPGAAMDYGDAAGSGTGIGQPISLHNRPSVTNGLLSATALTNDGPNGSGSRITPVMVTEAGYIAYAVVDAANGYTVGFNHMGHFYPVLYAVTGDYFYLEQMRFWNSFTSLWLPYIGIGDGTALNAYAGRGPTGAEALIPQTINQDQAGYGLALRVTSQIFAVRNETIAHEITCATISGGVCQPSTPAKYYLNVVKNTMAGYEGGKNYTGGFKTSGTALQISCWNWANNAQWKADKLAQNSGLSLGLPLNAWQDMDQPPALGDNVYGIANLSGGRGVENLYSGAVTTIAAHSSGTAVKLVTSALTAGAVTTTTLGVTTQAISGRINLTASSGTTPETVTFSSFPSYWTTGTKVFVGWNEANGFYNITTTADFGMLGIQSFSSVNSGALQATLTGTAPFPAGNTAFPAVAAPYAADQTFTVDSATATGIGAATNDSGGTGPPGVRVLIDSEYMMVCSVAGLTVTLCPLDNTTGARNTLLEFDAHDQMRGLWAAKFQNELPSDWLGQYYGAFWVNSLTDGTHTPRNDFNAYQMAVGRFPLVAPDGHTLISTWARANAGFDYYQQSLNFWLIHGCTGRNGLCYGHQLPAPVAQALDFGVTNAQAAWNWINNSLTGNLVPQTTINDPFMGKWLFGPSVLLCVVNNASLPAGDVSTAYSVTLTASNCGSGLTWSVTVGTLPTGLSLNAGTGAITGTPNGSPGTASFTVQVTDGGSNTATQALSITINAAPAITSTSPLSAGTTGVTYSTTLAGSGGTVPYTWTLNSGTLPTGLSLSTAGVISGIPTAANTFSFVVLLTDSVGGTVTKSLSITIGSNAITVLPSSFPVWTAGVTGFSQQFSASGGTAPYTWSAVGTLPPGLTITALGLLSGTPAIPGTYAVTIRCTDSTPQTADTTLSLVVFGMATGSGVQINGTVK